MKFCPVHNECVVKFKDLKTKLETNITDIHKHTTIMNNEFGNIQSDTKKILLILEGDPGKDDCPGLIMEFDRLKNKYESNNRWIMGLITLLALPLIYLLIQNLIK